MISYDCRRLRLICRYSQRVRCRRTSAVHTGFCRRRKTHAAATDTSGLHKHRPASCTSIENGFIYFNNKQPMRPQYIHICRRTKRLFENNVKFTVHLVIELLNLCELLNSVKSRCCQISLKSLIPSNPDYRKTPKQICNCRSNRVKNRAKGC